MAAMWSFDHSAIYRGLPLCLAIANDIYLAIWSTKNRSKNNLTATKVSIQLLQPNSQSRIRNKIKFINKTQEWWLDAPGLALIITMLASSQLDACGHPNTNRTWSAWISIFGSVWSSTYVKDGHNYIVQCMGYKVHYDAWSWAFYLY
jgi:hypothetical protein